jgi:hypothetical protein
VRAIHKEEFEALGLSVTRNLPSETPAKGFGVHPLESGSYWKLTPQMIERAKKYGIYEEIVKTAKELGLDVKEIQVGKGLTREAKKGIALIDKYNYDRFEEIGEFTKEFVRSNKDLFPHRELKEMVTENTDKYFMAINTRLGRIIVSTYEFKDFGLNPARDLRSALQKLKANQPLNFYEELALKNLWHELNHLRARIVVRLDSQVEDMIKETINEFYTRHTYYKLFVKRIKPDAKLQFKQMILERGYGYSIQVQNFRYMLKKLGVKEKEAVKELEEILLDDYALLYERVVAWIAEKAKLPETSVQKILEELAMSYEKQKFIEVLEEILGKGKAKRNRV